MEYLQQHMLVEYEINTGKLLGRIHPEVALETSKKWITINKLEIAFDKWNKER